MNRRNLCGVYMDKKRKGIKFAFAEPDLDMIIVSMLEFQGAVYVATQKGVYRIEDNDKMVRLELVDKTNET